MNSVTSPGKTPEVSQELKRLQEAVNQIIDTTSQLHERFQSVIRMEPAAPESNTKDVDQVVPLAGEIRMEYRKLLTCNRGLREIIDRCEL
jgi:hypothetical protein